MNLVDSSSFRIKAIKRGNFFLKCAHGGINKKYNSVHTFVSVRMIDLILLS